jgi:uncharacterized protein
LRAVERLAFVQADPIRAPARAQDLTLRHRVAGYRAGDLERHYPSLGLEEAFFINYGFLPRASHDLMHPRGTRGVWTATNRRRAAAILAFVRDIGTAHPRQVEAQFAHGAVTNYWGGRSSATTHLLEAMHYRGLLRVVRRDRGIRVYAVAERDHEARIAPAERRARLDRLIDLVIACYAPVPQISLSGTLGRLRWATPQWSAEVAPAIARAKKRLAFADVDGMRWYLPAGEDPAAAQQTSDEVRLLAPFDPLVWDRRRFERFWSWEYRFEAYTPVPRRRYGYYALPVLFGERMVGWANATVTDGRLDCRVGRIDTRARDRRFTRALDAEIERMRAFLATDAG